MTGLGADLAARVERWADHRPDAPAVAFEGIEHSYRSFAEQIAATARWLAGAGVGEGDRVAWLGPNRPAALRLMLGCSWLGAVYLPLNSRLAPPEHRWILQHADPRLLVLDAAFERHGASIEVPCETQVVPDEPECSDAPGALAPRRGTSAHPVLLAYTSGTTGHPKGAVLDQAAMAANAVNATHAHDLTSRDRVLTAIPLFHVGGLNIQTLPALLGGASVLIQRTFDADQFLADVEQWQPTWTVLVPTALAAVAAHPRFATADLSSLHGIMTGSAPVPAATTAPFFDRGVPVGQIYGSTETAPIATHLRCDQAAARPGSCGKPSTMCEVRIVTDAGDDATPGQRGELWVRGPSVLREYWRDPQASAEALRDGWFRTGDIGHVDRDGWMYIDDRRTDMIISGGENVYPAELEAVLARSDLAREATVVGVPDERWGEVPVIVAVPPSDRTKTSGACGNQDRASEDQADQDRASQDRADQDRANDAAALLRLFDGRLARFKHPKAVFWTDELPRTALGKVRKHEVRAMLREQQSASPPRARCLSGDGQSAQRQNVPDVR
ncbi:class I adenylate-forming enzyme family protein [Candidatus Poriferisodalis sp.]|uniref:class I adenylate-forming enzyme family protein n=1 Tax=Candidatus Poriferisodalis sp. TaxID=3101277 RepID=UPI003B01520C